ncbi:hypothetical protein DP939_15175 [Spongiactinospora rosea]|uniref:Uncharacterized protein n=1 Tax=Spongiactinospora rosea TaxID=2248750 RepID=A0A366LZA6_9ACTN|nr:hypothetical protein [Spongiactinospora rosea]RBQ19275.1 hypothetical protein DP939_15175 [Spongiactinospora rosea]
MSERPGELADIEFSASVSAGRMRFEEVPDSTVTYSQASGPESGHGSRRRGLPRPVQEGVDYEDVEVHYDLAARISRPR